ncbi:transcriptional regulator family: Fungal Specific TF [Penicillium alfredii]|uniref:Transcriptional regulator family: Fungal Specific TF n=1 Tax=Penicillium alfredii TaxID=1506179 RepID=A0A9W9K4U3_9EURO|nr:transcriptional regulator family: Fungal Specific TF [Penicillium alfredii]KAJ5092641.1 transcriptional regulator family: Fungal Specific TF [Penicillium alfredii]
MPAAVDEMTSTSSSQAAMDNDKKRNKLGYHRTSVACVHCRRRKIRCLVAPDDAQGRCENCIRLRKECQFFPVDQQPPVEKKSRPSSRLETPSTERSTTASITSSPTNLVPDPNEAFYPYPMAFNTTSATDMSTYNTTMVSTPMMGFVPDRPMAPNDFSGPPSMDTGVAWDEFTTISDPQILATMTGKSQMMNLAPNVWNPGTIPSGLPPNSPMSGTSPMASQAQSMSAPAYTMQPDGSVWQVPPPLRTMSYPGQGDMASTYPNQFPPQVNSDLKRRMTTPAQTFSTTTAAGAQSSPNPSPDMQTAAGPVPYAGQAAMGFPQWQDMGAMSGIGVVPYPMYAGEAVQQPAFPTNPPPMGHPGAPGHSPGS